MEAVNMKKPEMTRSGKTLNYRMRIEAPVEAVYEARTNLSLVPKYFHTDRVKTKSIDGDFRKGGKIKLVMEDLEGNRIESDSKFLEIEPKKRVKYEIETTHMPGKKFWIEEWGDDEKNRTVYNVRVSFNQEEDLYRMMDIGWHLSWIEYISRFGRFVEDMQHGEKVPTVGS